MNIEAMAREAGFGPLTIPCIEHEDPKFNFAFVRDEYCVGEELTKFAALVRAEALREAAGICGADAARLFNNGSGFAAEVMEYGQSLILAAIDSPPSDSEQKR